MSSTIDPKLYEAVRRGNERYFKEHALISNAEKAAFESTPNPANRVQAFEQTNATGVVNKGDVSINVREGTEASNLQAIAPINFNNEPAITEVLNYPKPQRPSDPDPKGTSVSNTQETAVPDTQGPSIRDAQRPPGHPPQGTAVTMNKHPLYGVTWAGDTVLHIAVRFGRNSLAHKICNVNISFLTMANYNKETPLHYAAQVGNDDLVGFFLDLAREKRGNSYLVDLLKMQNKDSETALYQAVHHQHNKVVQVLMSEDVGQASFPDENNRSPLYLATILSSIPIVTTMVKRLQPARDVQPAAYSGPDGETALHAAVVSGTKCVQMILTWKGDMTKAITGTSKNTPLHYAVFNNNHIAAKMLLETDRASAYRPNSSGLYPIHVAAKLGFVQVVETLFKQCPDSGELLDREGRNFVHLAVEAKRIFLVLWVRNCSFLLEKAMNAQDNYGNTPLHLAVRAGDSYCVLFLLLSKKVHLNGVNSERLTPLDIALAQLKSGFSDMQNPDNVIYETLCAIGCTFGIHCSTSIKAETGQQRDHGERNKKEMKMCEGMEKNMSVGSVLIASAAFAAAFTVYRIYIDQKNMHDNPQLKLAFHLFFILDAYAFLCSMIATILLVESALPFVDLRYRKRYLVLCTSLVKLSAKCFMVAFTTAAYVILTPIMKWLAIVIYVVGAIVILIDPRTWPNIFVLWTILKYRRSNRGCVSVALKQCIPLSYKTLYMFCVLVVLRVSNPDLSPAKQCGPISCADMPLVIVIIFLGLLSLALFFSTLLRTRLVLGAGGGSKRYHSKTILRTFRTI